MHEADYQLLPRVTGLKTCASEAELAAWRSEDRYTWLVDFATAKGLASVEDADGVLARRAVYTYESNSLCVTVDFRPYRLTSVRAVRTIQPTESTSSTPLLPKSLGPLPTIVEPPKK